MRRPRALLATLLLALAVQSHAALTNAETNALEALYHATGGAAWPDPWPLAEADPCAAWAGVTCDANHTTVTHLDLEARGLVGELPEALGQLTGLVSLDLDDNSLFGPLPASLWSGELAQLWEVRLRGNALNGSLPAAFGNYSGPASIRIDVGDNQLTGSLPPGPAYEWIEHFFVDNNQLEGPLPWNFEGIEFVGENNAFSGAALPFANATRLETFRMAGNALTTMAPAPLDLSLYRVTLLDVAENNISGPLFDVHQPADRPCRLNTVNVQNNAFAGELPASWAALFACPSLLVVYLDGNLLQGSLDVIDPDAVTLPSASATGLVSLQLHGNDFDCAVPDRLRCWAPAPFLYSLPPCGELLSAAAEATSGSSAVVSWGDPTTTDARGFTVVYEPLESGDVTCSSPVGCSAGPDARECTVSGLDPATDYMFVAYPFYAWGNSTALFTTDRVASLQAARGEATTADGLPGAVTPAVDWVESDAAQVSWAPLGFLEAGGFPVTAYTATTSDGRSSCQGGSGASSCVLRGLAEDESFRVTVVATNAVGDGPASAAAAGHTCSEFERARGTECFACFSPGCDGSQECRADFVGELCADCVEGHYAFALSCSPCKQAAWTVALGVGVLLAGGAVMWRLKQSSVAGMLMWGLVQSLQLSMLALTYTSAQRITALGVARSLLELLVGFDLRALHAECVLSSGSRWLAWHVTAVYVQPLLAAGAVWLALRATRKEGPRAQEAVQNVAVVAASMYVVPYSRALFVALSCVNLPSGGRALLDDNSVDCAAPTTRAAQGAATAIAALLVLALLWMAQLLRRLRAQNRLHDPDVVRRFGPFYWKYKTAHVHFHVQSMLRRVALVAVATALPAFPLLQVALGSAVAAAHLVYVALLRPFDERERASSVLGVHARRWLLQRRGRVLRIDVANSSELWRAASVLALHALLLGGELLGDAEPLEPLVALVIAQHVLLACGTVLVNVRELRRGFRDVDVRAQGARLQAELKTAQATLDQLTQQRRYMFASEVRDSLAVLRSSAASGTGGEVMDAVEHGRRVVLPRRDELLERTRAAAAAACPACSGGKPQADFVAQQVGWLAAELAALERTAAAVEAFEAAEELSGDQLAAGRLVLRETVAHVAAHAEGCVAALRRPGQLSRDNVAAVDGALRHLGSLFPPAAAGKAQVSPSGGGGGGVAAMVPAGQWAAARADVRRRRQALVREVERLMRDAGAVAVAGFQTLAERWGARLPIEVSEEQWRAAAARRAARRRRRRRAVRGALALLLALALAVPLALVAAAAAGDGDGGDGGASGASGSGGEELDTTCLALESASAECGLAVGDVGSGALFGLETSGDVLAAVSGFAEGMTLLPILVPMSGQCQAALTTMGCATGFAPCGADCQPQQLCPADVCPNLFADPLCTQTEVDNVYAFLTDPSQLQYVIAVAGEQLYAVLLQLFSACSSGGEEFGPFPVYCSGSASGSASGLSGSSGGGGCVL